MHSTTNSANRHMHSLTLTGDPLRTVERYRKLGPVYLRCVWRRGYHFIKVQKLQ